MKRTSCWWIFTILIGSIAATEIQTDITLFHQWKLNFQKNYSSIKEESQAFRTWITNKVIVEKINNTPNRKWSAELNTFADFTMEEFQKRILLSPIVAHTIQKEKKQTKQSNRTILKSQQMNPLSFDWRTDGNRTVVTTVKDQGSVGTCWAFSTVGNIEGQWALAGNTLVDLSPEYLVDCDGTVDGNHGDCSVFGGWPYLAYQFVINTKGIPSEADWPYCAGTGACYPCMQGPISVCGPPPYYCDKEIETKCPTENHLITATITDYSDISSDENEIAEELVQRGPLSVLLDATELQFYKSGIWDGYVPGMNPLLGCRDGFNASLDHAVLLVGYGSENNVDYWTIKNSWGEKWGEKGYFRITKGFQTCGINTAVTSAIV